MNSPCLDHPTGNHYYRSVKGRDMGYTSYRCKYCDDFKEKKPDLLPHVHNYKAYIGKDLLFCTTCGNTRSI